MSQFPSPRLRLALAGYTALWYLGLPAVLLYLRKRAKKDPAYGANLRERFGHHAPWPAGPRTIWIHAVSLGEMRSAVPLIRAILARGDRIVTTHFTPAGRKEAETVFAKEIAEGRLRSVWVPFEFGFAFRRFFKTFTPALGLVMEVEIWPKMIMSARRAGIGLYMCNAQYPSKSYARDQAGSGLRGEIMQGFAGALVKSDLQRQRFASVGVHPIEITGELRFDQPIPPHLVARGEAVREQIAPKRPVLVLTSVVSGEDALYISAIKKCIAKGYNPLFIYVPRAPERFDEVSSMLKDAGLRVVRRSKVLAPDLTLTAPFEADVLLGDSMGEMYFYLAIGDAALVGGGFIPKGAHNISEPLALRKPVIVGPEIFTIEYPAMEAIAAGVVTYVTTPDALDEAIETFMQNINLALQCVELKNNSKIDAFLDAHAGSVDKTLAALDRLAPLG
ncbi:3-deoxy-D-manno-octulosonic acid transferase [Albirhodobacter sp. R86504]|uniref:3-deoxy-D-manno-octulosonic acid transferase n=1 Tax=Albirhodobacter sp. R86504 TaxID=3093848 RepID=UPI003671C501